MSKVNLKAWHKEVCEKAGYVCQICGVSFNYECYFNEKGVNQMVCGHHLKTQKSHPELRLDPSNGLCVCNTPHPKNQGAGCHNFIHSKGLENISKI